MIVVVAAGFMSHATGVIITPDELETCFISNTTNQYQVDYDKLKQYGECAASMMQLQSSPRVISSMHSSRCHTIEVVTVMNLSRVVTFCCDSKQDHQEPKACKLTCNPSF